MKIAAMMVKDMNPSSWSHEQDYSGNLFIDIFPGQSSCGWRLWWHQSQNRILQKQRRDQYRD
jgi:hypothetical protein